MTPPASSASSPPTPKKRAPQGAASAKQAAKKIAPPPAASSAPSVSTSPIIKAAFDGTASGSEHAPVVVIAIPAQAEFVRVVRLAVAGVATRMRFSYEQVEDIKLAVSEACNNAILHAAPAGGRAATQVVVRMRPSEQRLEITVFDQGHVAAPGLEMPEGGNDWHGLDDLPEGGMGLLLIQSLMDEVSSHAGAPDHTALRMVKNTSLF
jgi:serine/threonine-protein kinase RsbW